MQEKLCAPMVVTRGPGSAPRILPETPIYFIILPSRPPVPLGAQQLQYVVSDSTYGALSKFSLGDLVLHERCDPLQAKIERTHHVDNRCTKQNFVDPKCFEWLEMSFRGSQMPCAGMPNALHRHAKCLAQACQMSCA